MFDFEEKMLLRYLDIEILIRLLEKMYQQKTKCFILFVLNVPPPQRRVNKMTPEGNIVPPSQRPEGNNCSPVSTTGQQNDTRGKYCPGKTPGQQNDIGVAKRHLTKNDTRGKYCTFIHY